MRPRLWYPTFGGTVVLDSFGNANVQYFYRDWYAPKDGYYEPPAGPGFGYELDEGRITSHADLP